MVVLISTIWKGPAVIQAIKLFSPSKVYFIVDDPVDESRQTAIDMVKSLFEEIDFLTLPAKIYDIVGIAKVAIGAIQKEKEEKIIVHISEGRKTMSMGLLFGAYACRKAVDSVYYITQETNTPIKLPLIDMKLTKQKRFILEHVKKERVDIDKLAQDLEIKNSTLYVHLKELRDDGFLDKNNTLTEMGKIVLINSENE